jgi:chromosome segregation ATPase
MQQKYEEQQQFIKEIHQQLIARDEVIQELTAQNKCLDNELRQAKPAIENRNVKIQILSEAIESLQLDIAILQGKNEHGIRLDEERRKMLRRLGRGTGPVTVYAGESVAELLKREMEKNREKIIKELDNE